MTRAEREQQKAVLERLQRDARQLAERFRLPLGGLDAERPRVTRRYGICYDDGTIKIRLRHLRTGELLQYSGLIDTLCHELAHLRHFNHGVRFQTLYRRILEYARRNGIYRPAARVAGPPPQPLAQRPMSRDPPRRVPTGPIQLELFPADRGGRIRDP